MAVYLVRIVALLIAALLFYAAYMSPSEATAFVIGGMFFVVMAYLSFKNSGAIDSPYIYFGLSAVTLFYNFAGFISGTYTWHRYQVTLQANPLGFWSVFSILLLLSIGGFIYAFTKLRKQNHT